MDAKQAQELFGQADQMYRADQFAGALEILDRLDRTFPNTKRIMHPRARCLHRLKRNEEALELCSHIISWYDYAKTKELKARIEAEQVAPNIVIPQMGDDVEIPLLDDELHVSRLDAAIQIPQLEDDDAFEPLDIEVGEVSPAFTAPVPDSPAEGPGPWLLTGGIAVLVIMVLAGGYFFLFYGGGNAARGEIDFESPQAVEDAVALLMGPLIGSLLILAAVTLFYTAVAWLLYVKAGQPGWAVLVPIYNMIVYIQICERPIWWIVLLFLPVANFVIPIILMLDFNRKFGQPTWHIILALFFGFVYYPYLAFSSSVTYEG